MAVFANLGKWQNYLHYILLGLALWGFYNLGLIRNVYILIGLIFVVDTIIHGIFYFAPEPIQWRD